MTLVDNYPFFFFGRCIEGFAIGLNMVATPLYLNAHVPHTSKGMAGSFQMICFAAGALFEYISGYADPLYTNSSWRAQEGWRLALGFWLLWPLVRVVLLRFVFKDACPDDKIAINKNDKALAIIKKVHTDDAQERFNELQALHQEDLQEKYKHYWKSHKRLLYIIILVAFIWNFTGFTYFISWTLFFFYMAAYPVQALDLGNQAGYNVDLAQNYCVLFGGLIFGGAVVGGFLNDKLGRKYNTFAGLLVCCIMMLAIGIIGYTAQESISANGAKILNGNVDSSGTMSCMCIWAAGFGVFSVGIYTFLLETLPKRGWTLFIGLFFIICFLLQLTAWDVYDSSNTAVVATAPDGTRIMGIYCFIICTILMVALFLLMKETHGMSAADIRAHYLGGQQQVHSQVPMSSGPREESKPIFASP